MIKRNKWLLLVLLLGGFCRVGLILYFFDDFQKDPDAYKQIAENIANNGRFSQRFGDHEFSQHTAFRPPLYPLTISLFVTEIDARGGMGSEAKKVDTASVALLHIWLSIFTIFVAYLYARQFNFSDFQSGVVAFLVALDPICIRQSSLVMTETMAVFFATLGLFWLGRVFQRNTGIRSLLFCGLMCGVFSMCRPTFLIWAALLFLAMSVFEFRNREFSFQKKLARLSMFLLGVVVAIAPWTLRNWQQFGKPVFATTHGGYTIYLGNNDSFYDYLRSGTSNVWNGEEELRDVVLEIRKASSTDRSKAGFEIDEIKKDKLYYDKALEVIQRRPFDFAYACFIRVVRFWSIIPYSSDNGSRTQTMIAIGSAIWYGTLFLAAVIGVFRLARLGRVNQAFGWRLWRKLLPAVLLVMTFQGLHLIYWSNMRMRAPLVVVIAVLAVASFVKSEALKKTDEESKEKSNSTTV